MKSVVMNHSEDGIPNFIPFVSKASSPFAAQWRFLIAEQLNTGVDCSLLKEFLLEKEDEVLSIRTDQLNDGGTGLGSDSTTARFLFYNVFSWKHPQIDKLKREIYRLYYQYISYCFPDNKLSSRDFNGISANCWLNVMRKGDRIKIHQHGYHPSGYLIGHFCVSCSNTATVYVNPYEHCDENELIEDVRGDMTQSRMIYHDGESDNDGEKLYASANREGKLTLFPTYVPHFTTEHKEDTERITLAFDLRPKYDNSVPLIDRPVCNWDSNRGEFILDETIFQD